MLMVDRHGGGERALSQPCGRGRAPRTPRNQAPRMAAPRMAAAPGGMDRTNAALGLRTAWARGDDATALRPLVEAAKDDPTARAAAVAAASSTDDWAGLWVARIEHFGKLGLVSID